MGSRVVASSSKGGIYFDLVYGQHTSKFPAMWQLIKDCGKQLNINFRVRQTVKDSDEYTTEYSIKEVEFDQYELQLVSKTKNGSPIGADTSEVLVFNCSQLLKYEFEVWTEVSK